MDKLMGQVLPVADLPEICVPGDVVCQIGNALTVFKGVFSVGASQATTAVQSSIVRSWATSTLSGLNDSLTAAGTFWVKASTPDVTSDPVLESVRGMTQWAAVALAVGSLMAAAIILMWTQRGQTVRDIARGLLILVLVSGAGTAVVGVLVQIADASAEAFLAEATSDPNTNFATKLLDVMQVGSGTVSLILIIILGLVGVVANLAQIGLMFVRSAMLLLLMVVLPLAAAASTTAWGRSWLRQMIGWILAFILMKPAAALIYAVAVELVEGTSPSLEADGELLRFVLGVIMMVLAALALPAMAQFIIPVAGLVGGGGGGTAAGVSAVVATGSMVVSRMSRSRSSRAPSGASSAPTRAGSAPGRHASGAAVAPRGASATAARGAGASGGAKAGAAAAGGAASGGVLLAAAVAAKALKAGARTASRAADQATSSPSGSGETRR